MRCPACRHPALEHDPSCGQCGFSLDALGSLLGIPPRMDAPLADLASVLSASERRGALRAIHNLHQRFPQISFAAVMMEVSETVPSAVQAFWLFNRGSLFSAVEKGGDNHGVLLLLNTKREQASAMIGYGLEPFVGEMTLEVCLAAASGSLGKSQYGSAIEAFVRELERQMTGIIHQLPRTFGYNEGALWKETHESSDHGLAAVPGAGGGSEDLY
jgi:uncharacterized membrane protein YgcG